MQQDALLDERSQFLPDGYASIPAFGRVSCFESGVCFDDFELSSSLFPDSLSSFSLPSAIPTTDFQLDSQSTLSDESRDCSSRDEDSRENPKQVDDGQFLLPRVEGVEVSVAVRPFCDRIGAPCGVFAVCGNGPREKVAEASYCSVGNAVSVGGVCSVGDAFSVGNAVSATHSSNAFSATHSSNAFSATHSSNAYSITNAFSATHSSNAFSATHSSNAYSITNAFSATHSSNAYSATNASHACPIPNTHACSVDIVPGTLSPENTESVSQERPSESSACDADCKQKSRFFSAEVREVLAQFMIEHMDYPYATRREKEVLMNLTGLSEKSITQFLSNWRRRHVLKPSRQRYSRSFYSSGFKRDIPFFSKQ